MYKEQNYTIRENHSIRRPELTRIARPHYKCVYIPVVVLITDSIMRHIENNTTGHQYYMVKVNKSKMADLKHQNTIKNITQHNPDFIYIHLGINDIHENTHPHDIMQHLIRFHRILTVYTEATVIVSLPLLNGTISDNDAVYTLREYMSRYIRAYKPTEDIRLLGNLNNNFFTYGQQKKQHFKYEDPLHLSFRGKLTITNNFKQTIISLTKQRLRYECKRQIQRQRQMDRQTNNTILKSKQCTLLKI